MVHRRRGASRPWLAAWLAAAAAISATSGFAEGVGDLTGVFRSEETRRAVAAPFTPADERLLEEVQRGCFNYLWNEVGWPSGFAKDRRTAEVASLAGVGFQLSALPIAVERGWITRKQGEAWALRILRTLRKRTDIRREGIYFHFVEANSGDVYPPFKNEASTVDHSLLLAGALPAAVYFGGETAELVDAIAKESNWRAFVSPDDGLLSMGWWPTDNKSAAGPGKLIPRTWNVAGDEERIIYFLAAGGENPEFALPPRDYYRLRREFRRHGTHPPFVASPSGTPFTYFFSHCWINYRDLDADDPRQFGVEAPRVDWFENSRRAMLVHRERCLDFADRYRSFGDERWGVSPCKGFENGRETYLVQATMPNLMDRDDWRDGTVAPYAAGSAIMFAPKESVAALRAFKQLKNDLGAPLAWRDPVHGGYAFADSFNLDQMKACDDNVSIDVGPMLLAIENARTGLVWKLFMQHPQAQRAVERLKLVRIAP
jgi:hypothetical protein